MWKASCRFTKLSRSARGLSPFIAITQSSGISKKSTGYHLGPSAPSFYSRCVLRHQQRPHVTQSVFHHVPLGKSEIRLLQLLPSSSNDAAVSCVLKNFTVADAPRYIGLSYVWGDSNVTENILVEGQEYPVTTNLSAFLRQLRAMTFSEPSVISPYFWADAICINQNSIPERNSQVKMMANIYRNAFTVFGWLGADPDGELGVAMQYIRNVSEQLAQTVHSGEGYSLISAPLRLDENQNPLIKHPELWKDSGPWITLDKLFESEYWRRLWIVQEAFLSMPDRFQIMAGSSYLPYHFIEVFAQGLNNLRKIQPPRPSFANPQTWNLVLGEIFGHPNTAASLSTFGNSDPIWLSLDRKCSEPRDCVFSLLALYDSAIAPDYAKPIRSVYSDLLIHLLHKNRDISFLAVAGVGIGVENDFDLPSWSPNWYNFPRCSVRPSAEAAVFRRGLSEHFNFGKPWISDDNVLHTYGVHCDNVLRIEQLLEARNVLDTGPSNILFEFAKNYISQNQGRLYKTGIPPLQAVVRVLMRDMDLGSANADGQFGKLDPASDSFRNFTLGFLRYLLQAPSEDGYQKFCIWRLKHLGFPLDQDFHYNYMKNVLGVENPQPGEGNNAREAWRKNPFVFYLKIMHFFLRFNRFRLFTTSDGYLGIGPRGMLPGDQICVIDRYAAPLVLRQVDSHYILVGVCFVLGLSEGEPVEMVKNKLLEVQEFRIH